MSYNNNFYDATFHNAFAPPPPPPHPPRLLPPRQSHRPTENDIIKHIESKLSHIKLQKLKPQLSISEVRNQIFNLVTNLNDIKTKETMLSEKVNDLSEDEWHLYLQEIEGNKKRVNEILLQINKLNFDVLRKLLSKRSAKRARLKRVHLERKREKEEWIKEMKERSRKIDENLQKIKDDIDKAKQEEESKIQADIILKETLRKKHDAKKCIVKVDALLKLRKARQNTAKGRGEGVAESEAVVFDTNIGKLKSLWIQKLAIYEKEELELRAKLKQDSGADTDGLKQSEREVADNLSQWRELMFRGTLPQVDFHGNVEEFISVRSSWDQYLDPEGTPIPVGWIPPVDRTQSVTLT